MQRAIGWLEEGVVVFGLDGRVIARNATFLQLLGISEEEGQRLASFEELLQAASGNATEPARFAAKWRALSASCMEGMREELAIQSPVAQTIERYARPIIGPGGKQLGRVEVYRGRHTWQVVEAKMAQAEHLVSLGLCATAIVHELNNPLTTILGNAQRLAQRNGDGECSEAAQIMREAERATGIVRQLLTVPRETEFEMQPVSLNELVESIVETLRGSLAGSRVRLKTQLQEGLPSVPGNREQLQQLLLNLLQNAVQAIQESGQGSSLMVRTESADPQRVRLEVQDDGPGIPESLHRRIFDPFFTTKPPGKGTGLGLAIVNAFVRNHGGTIALHSRAGEGAHFVVELPGTEGKKEHAQGDTGGAALELPIESGCPKGVNDLQFLERPKGPCVLVVEDEPTVANLIQDVLRDQGMETAVFSEAGQALEAVQRSRYDLAICDVHMPGMDGPLFFSALRQANSPLQQRILFVTGDEVAQRTSEFLAEHQLPYVTKPFRIEELCSAVRKMLNGQRQSAEPLNVD